jgi:hypothetical protein
MSEERPPQPLPSSAPAIAELENFPAPAEPAPETPPAWLQNLPDNSNPYAARLRENPTLGTVTLAERARLNALDSYYRGTVAGSLHLKTLGDVAAGGTAVDPNTGGPHPYLNQETARRELDQVREDLARYEAMPTFKGPLEAATALGGVLAGGAVSPESWITRFPGAAAAASWLGKAFGESASAVATRIMDTALSQGAIQVVTDPIAQAGALSTGIAEDYNYKRTALAFPLGAIFGGMLGAGHEAASAFLRNRGPSISRETLGAEARPGVAPELAPEAERVATEAAAPPREAPTIVPGEAPGTFRTEVTINGERTTIEGPTREAVATAAERARPPDGVTPEVPREPVKAGPAPIPSEAARIVAERAALGAEIRAPASSGYPGSRCPNASGWKRRHSRDAIAQTAPPDGFCGRAARRRSARPQPTFASRRPGWLPLLRARPCAAASAIFRSLPTWLIPRCGRDDWPRAISWGNMIPRRM